MIAPEASATVNRFTPAIVARESLRLRAYRRADGMRLMLKVNPLFIPIADTARNDYDEVLMAGYHVCCSRLWHAENHHKGATCSRSSTTDECQSKTTADGRYSVALDATT